MLPRLRVALSLILVARQIPFARAPPHGGALGVAIAPFFAYGQARPGRCFGTHLRPAHFLVVFLFTSVLSMGEKDLFDASHYAEYGGSTSSSLYGLEDEAGAFIMRVRGTLHLVLPLCFVAWAAWHRFEFSPTNAMHLASFAQLLTQGVARTIFATYVVAAGNLTDGPGHLVNTLLVWLPVLFVIDVGRGKQLFELIARQYEREYSSQDGGIMVVPHLLDRAPMAVPGAPRCARCLVKVDARLNTALSELSPCDDFPENLEETPHNAPDGGGVDGDA